MQLKNHFLGFCVKKEKSLRVTDCGTSAGYLYKRGKCVLCSSHTAETNCFIHLLQYYRPVSHHMHPWLIPVMSFSCVCDPPPASGGEILHPSLTVCRCHQSHRLATVTVLSPKLRVCVRVCTCYWDNGEPFSIVTGTSWCKEADCHSFLAQTKFVIGSPC